MPLVQAWQCPKSGLLFADRDRYVAYLKRQARKNLTARSDTRLRDSAILETAYDVLDLDALATWIMENARLLFVNSYSRNGPHENQTYFLRDVKFGKPVETSFYTDRLEGIVYYRVVSSEKDEDRMRGVSGLSLGRARKADKTGRRSCTYSIEASRFPKLFAMRKLLS